jgi:hypothetical protein
MMAVYDVELRMFAVASSLIAIPYFLFQPKLFGQHSAGVCCLPESTSFNRGVFTVNAVR